MSPRKSPPPASGPQPGPDNPLATLEATVDAGHLFGSRLRLSILLVLKHKGPSNIEEISEALGLARPTVHRALAELRHAGVVVATAEPPAFRPLIFHLDRKVLARYITTLRTNLILK
jgi:DNA-binding transcriptional ArsR family regulator